MRAPGRRWALDCLFFSVEAALPGEFFTISSNWQRWEGQSLQDPQGPKKSKHQNTEGVVHTERRAVDASLE